MTISYIHTHTHTPTACVPIVSEVIYTTKFSRRQNLSDVWKRSSPSGNTKASCIWRVTMQLSIFNSAEIYLPTLLHTNIWSKWFSKHKKMKSKQTQPVWIYSNINCWAWHDCNSSSKKSLRQKDKSWRSAWHT